MKSESELQNLILSTQQDLQRSSPGQTSLGGSTPTNSNSTLSPNTPLNIAESDAGSQSESTAIHQRQGGLQDVKRLRGNLKLVDEGKFVTKCRDTIKVPKQVQEIGRVSPFRKPNSIERSITAPPKLTNVSKHPRPEDIDTRAISTSERPSKRSRPKLQPRHTIDPETFSKAVNSKLAASPPSPLFFSHTPKRRPPLPPSFTSGEAAATMMNKARDEPGGITTLKLARGSISSSSPPRANGTPGSWGSIDRSSLPRSPDPRGAKPSPGMQILGSVGIIELLEQDDRPTFIIDVANPLNFSPGAPLQLVFVNAALRASYAILEMIAGKADLDSPGIAVTNDFPEFKAWALSFVKNNESLDICLPSFVYGGVTWSCSTLRKRLRLISGNSSIITTTSSSSAGTMSSSTLLDRVRGPVTNLAPSPLAQSHEPADYFGDAQAEDVFPVSVSPRAQSSPGSIESAGSPKQAMIAAQDSAYTSEMLRTRYPEGSSFDWTRLPMSAALPRHIQFAKSFDWASTPLGPMESWTFDLRAMCNLIMGSPHPAAMYWGPDLITIYNEAYIMLAGQKHPTLMGQSYKTAWAEIWHEVEDALLSAFNSGQATMKDDDRLFIMRNGYLEESYFSWSIIPLVGEDGSVVGLYNPAFEKTRRKIAERRMLTLREVGEKTAAAREVKGFWGQVIKGLKYNDYDVPFAFLYSVSDDPDSDRSSMTSGSLSQAPSFVLEGTLGVPEGHRSAISPLDLKSMDDGFAPYFRESMKTARPVLLSTEDGTLSFDLIEGLEWRGFGDPCRAAVVCPIHPTTGDAILGFLVMGVNPRRPYDDDYSLFIQLLSRQLATSIASVILFEEEIRRGQKAARLAALDRQELSKQLDLRTQEAVESETRFTRMAEFAPVGMFIANSAGTITYSNDTWWEISRHPRTQDSVSTWMESIKDEDRPSVQAVWESLVNTKTPVTHEFRFKTPWQDRNGSRGDTWVLMSAYPERDQGGHLKSVFGSITNISQQKWAEDFQKRRMEEAIELKRQQENFIDMTSHEMRNPLSAILQCSDEITTSLQNYRAANESPQKLSEIIDGNIDAAQTIALCAQHQKRIVDDILTLSKLDSALLIVTPVAVQPVAVVQRALKMFEGELDTNDIAMEFKMEKSFLELNIDWVKLDPSRLLQVLINLTTNAIKFTHGEPNRTIIVSVGASRERPNGHHSGVSYFPSRSKGKDVTINQLEWGTGEELYLLFAVQDTGRGLDEKEKTLLFQRFSQASPRTHVQYGGSGLGLFISRELTELQGGEIGVSSERGIGSTFAFYVKARRVDDIPSDTPIANAINSLRRNASVSSVTVESRRNSAGKPLYRSNTNSSRRSPGTSPIPYETTPPPLPTPAPSLDPTKLKVLIVEDNLVNQRVLQKQLKNIGFTVSVANHGGEALEILKTSRFWQGKEEDGEDLAVILMDLEMPIMDGLTCARKIREFEADGTIVKHVPIIAVTANARLEQIETALTAGMDDVVSKPFRIPELIPKIEDLVNRSNPATPRSENTVEPSTSKTDESATPVAE